MTYMKNASMEMRKVMVHGVLLSYPNFSKIFIIHIDVENFILGE